MKLPPHSKLVMIGDSITDCERSRPVGEGLFGALGKGYPALVDGLLAAAYPAHAIRVVNQGVSGNTVRDLAARWDADVLALKPDWLSILIGVNDVWRQFDLPRQPELAVTLEDYERIYDGLLSRTRARLKGLVLLAPFFIEPSRADAMRARMDAYGAVVKKLAAKHEAVFVDTQAAFDRVLTHLPSASIAWDRVHPNHIGHTVIARAFLDTVDFNWLHS